MPLATAAANDYFRFPKAEELSYFVHDLKNIQFGVKEEKRNKKIFKHLRSWNQNFDFLFPLKNYSNRLLK